MDAHWHRIHGKLNSLHEQLFRPIPDLFFSCETGEPFIHCTGCGKNLIEDRATYLVEKVYQRGEVIVEFAMCHECLKPVREEISEESKSALQKFFKENRKVWQDLTRCNLCLQPLEELVSFKILADCSGNQLFSLGHPTTICGTCHGKVSECISELTRKNMDQHRDLFVPDPPMAEKSLPGVPVEDVPV